MGFVGTLPLKNRFQRWLATVRCQTAEDGSDGRTDMPSGERSETIRTIQPKRFISVLELRAALNQSEAVALFVD